MPTSRAAGSTRCTAAKPRRPTCSWSGTRTRRRWRPTAPPTTSRRSAKRWASSWTAGPRCCGSARWSSRSPAGQLDGVAEGAQALGQPVAVVALDLHDPLLEGAAGAAQPLELAGARLQRRAALGQPVDHGHGLAVVTAAIAEKPNDAVARDRRLHGRNLAESVRRNRCRLSDWAPRTGPEEFS